MLNRTNSKRSEFTEVTGTDGVSNSKFSGMGTSDGASSKRSANSDKESANGDAEKKDEENEENHDEQEKSQNQVLPMMN